MKQVTSPEILLVFLLCALPVASVFGQAGTLDPTFGDGGIVTTNLDGSASNDLALDDFSLQSVAIQQDGKRVVVTTTAHVGGYWIDVLRYAEDGTRDATFGTDGHVVLNFSTGSSMVSSVQVAADGKIVVVGSATTEDAHYGEYWDFAVARLNPDGSLDNSFSSDGIVTLDLSQSNGYDAAYDVAIDADGKIVVAGSSVVRLLPDGSLDETFGTGGIVTIHPVHAIAIDASGKIVVAGSSTQGTDAQDFAVARLNTDGSFDTTFGTDGFITTHLGGFDAAYDVAIDADGKIVLAGSTYPAQTGEDMAVVRYHIDGSLDHTFSTDGITTIDSGIDERALAVAIDADGKIVLAGWSDQGINGKAIAVLRLNTDASLDHTFGTDGIVTTYLSSQSPNFDQAHDVAIDARGKIVVVGWSDQESRGTVTDLVQVQYDTTGALDKDFGIDGVLIEDIQGPVQNGATDVAVTRPDGKIVLIGTSIGFFEVLRYDEEGRLDATFGNNGVVRMRFTETRLSGSDLAIGASGKIVVAGSSNQGTSGNDFMVMRLNADGSFDDTFGTGGIVSFHLSSQSEGSDRANTVAIDDAGKIVVGGYSRQTTSRDDFTVIRLNDDGSLDKTFGNKGVVIMHLSSDAGGHSAASSLVIDTGGKIVVAGTSSQGATGTDFTVVRLNADGSLDDTFGSGGTVTSNLAGDDAANAAVIDASGKIVVAGRSDQGTTLTDFVVARLNPDGSFDDTFNTDGIVTMHVTTSDRASNDGAVEIAIDANGKIVVVGSSDMGFVGEDIFFATVLMRINMDGSLDDTFGTAGIVITDLSDRAPRWSRPTGMAIDDGGGIVVAGITGYFTPRGTGDDILLVRYLGSDMIHEPIAAFVTGDGWFESPAGAYKADPTLTGKANLNFVSRYKQGATTPEGQTQFQFKAAKLKFNSQVYQWLTIDGAEAVYQGTGTINGKGSFGFLLTAIDGQVNGAKDPDQVRIQIWTKNPDGTDGALVYDNGGTVFGGGIVKIHTEVDTTPPECEIVELVKGGNLKVRVMDTESGLLDITVLKQVNATVTHDPLVVGTNDPVMVIAAKIDPDKKSVLVLRVTDVAENAIDCDPVLTRLEADTPVSFLLEQNYPNPFNPTTTIDYALPEAGHTTLVVFNLLGQEVARLVDADQVAGHYSVRFDASPLKSGIYLYVINSGRYRSVKRMTLIK